MNSVSGGNCRLCSIYKGGGVAGVEMRRYSNTALYPSGFPFKFCVNGIRLDLLGSFIRTNVSRVLEMSYSFRTQFTGRAEL